MLIITLLVELKEDRPRTVMSLEPLEHVTSSNSVLSRAAVARFIGLTLERPLLHVSLYL